MGSSHTNSYLHILSVSASSQPQCKEKYMQDFQFAAGSRNETSMALLGILTKGRVLYAFMFYTMENQGGRCSIHWIQLNLNSLWVNLVSSYLVLVGLTYFLHFFLPPSFLSFRWVIGLLHVKECKVCFSMYMKHSILIPTVTFPRSYSKINRAISIFYTL